MNKHDDLTANKNTMKNELAAIDDLEINALTDEELSAVAGAFYDKDKNTTTVASCMCCCAACTNFPTG